MRAPSVRPPTSATPEVPLVGRRRALLGALGALGALGLFASGCGGAQKKTEYDQLKTPDDRTAVAWIARAFRKHGLEPEGARTIDVGNGGSLVVDVVAQDHPWGVSWLRQDEEQELKGKLPPAPESSDKLWVHRGVGDDGDFAVLILRARDFDYDPDPRGEGVVHSIQESEARTMRDVGDFLRHAQAGEFQ
jgi:hypothetical protein